MTQNPTHLAEPALHCESCGVTEVGMIPNLDLILCAPCGLVAVGFLPDYTVTAVPPSDEVEAAAAELVRSIHILRQHGIVGDTGVGLVDAVVARVASRSTNTVAA